MGLFDIKGGACINPVYEIGSPVFDEIHIRLDDEYFSGKTLSIIVKGNSEETPVVGEIKLNGKQLDGFSISHDDIINGGTIELKMEKMI